MSHVWRNRGLIDTGINEKILRVYDTTRDEFKGFAKSHNTTQPEALLILLEHEPNFEIPYLKIETNLHSIHPHDNVHIDYARALKNKYAINSDDEFVLRLLHGKQKDDAMCSHDVQTLQNEIEIIGSNKRVVRNIIPPERKEPPIEDGEDINISHITNEWLLRKQLKYKDLDDAPQHVMIQRLLDSSNIEYVPSYRLGYKKLASRTDVRIQVPKPMFEQLKTICEKNNIINDELIWRLIQNDKKQKIKKI